MEPADHKCELCPKSFTEKKNLNRHKRQVHNGEKQHLCGICSRTFSRKTNKDLHLKTCSNKVNIGGEIQKKSYKTSSNLEFIPKKKSSAFGGIIAEWVIEYPRDYNCIDPILLLKKSTAAMKDIILRHNSSQTKRLKYNMYIHVIFEKGTDPEIKTIPPVVLRAAPRTIPSKMQLIDEFVGVGSGWIIDHLVRLDTSLNSF